MQATVIINIAKNGYFVRYYTSPQRSDLPSASVVGQVESVAPVGFGLREESVIITDEQELANFLKQLRTRYYP